MSSSIARDLVGPGASSGLPVARPRASHACDDDFGGSSLDPKWSTWDVAGILTKSIDTTRRMLKLSAAGNGTTRWSGIYQPVPASEFAVYAKVHPITPHADSMLCAIIIATDLAGAPSTADFATNSKAVYNTTNVGAANSSHSTAYNSTTTQAVHIVYSNPVYLRTRVNGVTLYADWSVDGVAWSWYQTITLSSAPLYFGLGLNPIANLSSLIMLVDFFRVFSGPGTSGIDATYIGRAA